MTPDILDKLRSKPVEVRRLIAFWTSAIITFVIVAFWATSLPTRFDEISNNIENVASVSETKSISVFSVVGDFFSSIGSMFRGTLEYNSPN